MRVFVTGATGFIGSYLVPELIGAGHTVVGLCRSNKGADALSRAGAKVVRGDVNDLDCLRSAARTSDGIIHAAFDHAPAGQQRNSAQDRCAVRALGAALAGSDRPLVVTSGTGLVRSRDGRPARETDVHLTSADHPRAATEEAADDLIADGQRVMLMRLSQVHDTRRQGRISWHIDLARQQRRVAFVGDGSNRVAAVHVSDAVRLYRLALERGEAGERYHAVAEQGVTLRAIAEAIGAALHLPVAPVTPEQAPSYFGWMAPLAMADMPASAAITRQRLGWEPNGASLIDDLRRLVKVPDA